MESTEVKTEPPEETLTSVIKIEEHPIKFETVEDQLVERSQNVGVCISRCWQNCIETKHNKWDSQSLNMPPSTSSTIIRTSECSSECETEGTPIKNCLLESEFVDCSKFITDDNVDQSSFTDVNAGFVKVEELSSDHNAKQNYEGSKIADETKNDNCCVFSDTSIKVRFNEISTVLENDREQEIADIGKLSQTYHKNKKLREKGAPYVGRSTKVGGGMKYLHKKERKMKPTCKSTFCAKSSKRFCNEFSEQDRLQNFEEFWRHSWVEKKSIVKSLVEKTEPKYFRGPRLISPKSFTLKYHLFKSDGKRYPVCKHFFCNTLDIDRGMINRWMLASTAHAEEKKEQTSQLPNETSESKVLRKRRIGSEKNAERIRKMENFLDSLPRVPSHYCRASTSREYLERPFHSIRQIYRLYKEDVHESTPLGWSSFLKIFRQKKLSIFKPKEDQCNFCTVCHGNMTNDCLENEQTQQEKWRNIDNTNSDTYVLCAELQSALPSPQLFVTAACYKSKLNCHNYTFCNLKNMNDVECYLFSEDEAGLESDVFITCLLDHLSNVLQKHHSIKRIILYTNSCPPNQNVTLSNALLHFCIVHNIILEQKFLAAGHTDIEVHKMHYIIERQCCKKIIATPKDYVERIVSCRLSKSRNVPYTVHYVKSRFFKAHKNEYYSNIHCNTKSGDYIIRALMYDPSGLIYYKLSFQDDWSLLPNKLEKSVLKPSTQLYNTKPGITDSKRKQLLELCPYLPEYAQNFYKNL